VCSYCEHDTRFFQDDGRPINLLLRPEIARHVRHAHYAGLLACGYYEWPFDTLITRFKFNRDLRGAASLCRWLNGPIQQYLEHQSGSICPQLLLPVPLRPSGYWQRQFNQAQIMAEAIAKKWHIEVNYGWAQRVAGKAQHQQNRAQRLVNLRRAFKVKPLPRVQSVAIIDDVITTGCTADALAGLLRHQYPHLHIQVWTLAVTRSPRAR